MHIKKFGAGFSLGSLLGHITLTSLAAFAVNTAFIGDAHAEWFDSDWPFRVDINIQAAEVDETVTNFPVYVNLASLPTDFWDRIQSSGEIRVTASDGTTEMPREIVSFTDNGSSGSGEMYFKANSISSSSNTTFYVYYGNGTASGVEPTTGTDGYDEDDTWDSAFNGVWHFEDTTDSTSNGLDGTHTTGSAIASSGQYGNQLSLTGTNSRMSFTEQDLTDYTISAWIKRGDTGNSHLGVMGETDYMWWRYQSPTSRRVVFNNVSDKYTSTYWNPVQDEWIHYTFTRSGTTNKVYVNGIQKDEDTTAHTDTFSVGSWGSDWSGIKGDFDEGRIQDTARSADWVSTEYNNLNAPASFYLVGSHEAGDVTDPTLSTYSPADDATNISTTANLVLNFSENVNVEAGASNDIVIKKTSDNSTIETIDAQDGKVTGDGTDTITINPATTLDSETGYYVQIGADAFDDPSGNSYAGINDTTTWSFTTIDETAPTMSTLSPADDATDGTRTGNLVITFDDTMTPQTGASNDIVIYLASDDSIIETIDAMSAKVTGSGTDTITINPDANLDNETEYYVQIGADAFDDDGGNDYVGISDTTSWGFTTQNSFLLPSGIISRDDSNDIVNIDAANTSKSFFLNKESTGKHIALFAADVTTQRDWSTATVDHDTQKSLFHYAAGFGSLPGKQGASFTLYIPKLTNQNSVRVCPNAETLNEISGDCAGGSNYTEDDNNVIAGNVDGSNYWIVSGLTGTGGMGLGGLPSATLNDIPLISTDSNDVVAIDPLAGETLSTGNLYQQLILDLPLKSKYTNATTNRSDDRSPHNYHGTLSGTTVGSDSYDFDGSNDYVSLPSSVKDYFEDGTFSVSLWINADTITGEDRIFSVDYLANGNNSFYIMVDSENISVNVADGSSTSTITEPITSGLYYHVVVTSSAGGNITLYLNGISIDTATARTFSEANNEVHLGRSSTNFAADKYFDGKIANVKVYDRAVSDGEAKLLFDKGR